MVVERNIGEVVDDQTYRYSTDEYAVEEGYTPHQLVLALAELLEHHQEAQAYVENAEYKVGRTDQYTVAQYDADLKQTAAEFEPPHGQVVDLYELHSKVDEAAAQCQCNCHSDIDDAYHDLVDMRVADDAAETEIHYYNLQQEGVCFDGVRHYWQQGSDHPSQPLALIIILDCPECQYN